MAALAAAGALGGGEGVDADFAPDLRLDDGATVAGAEWRLTALHTPGHLGNHMCFAWDGQVFTGDHVMSWATTMVSPPDGDIGDFMASLAKLAARAGDRLFLPGHGAPLPDPAAMLAHQAAHRRAREAQILAALADGPDAAGALARRIYTEIPAALLPAAARNVLAHLIDLQRKSIVRCDGPLAADARFALA
jgi:hydroxyacylglutathione hydrolase